MLRVLAIVLWLLAPLWAALGLLGAVWWAGLPVGTAVDYDGKTVVK